jgi:threonine/homoserine/homoserine lactone efflux protein
VEHLAPLPGLAVVHLLAVASAGPSTVLVARAASVSSSAGGAAQVFARALLRQRGNPKFTWLALLASAFSGATARAFYRRAKFWLDRIMGGALALLGLRLALSAR